MEHKRQFWIFAALSLLWAGIIFWQSSMPAAQSDAESLGALGWVQRLLPFMTNHLLRKAAHVTEFAILGGLLAAAADALRRKAFLAPYLLGLLWALGDETHQLYVPGRSGALTDVWVDFIGVVVGATVVWLCHRKHQKCKSQ